MRTRREMDKTKIATIIAEQITLGDGWSREQAAAVNVDGWTFDLYDSTRRQWVRRGPVFLTPAELDQAYRLGELLTLA